MQNTTGTEERSGGLKPGVKYTPERRRSAASVVAIGSRTESLRAARDSGCVPGNRAITSSEKRPMPCGPDQRGS